jgi:chaperone modulatory protein CbpM
MEPDAFIQSQGKTGAGIMKKIYLIREAVQEFGIDEEHFIEYILKEWITPAGPSQVDEEDIARARLISELQEVFGVNDEAVPIILHLLDQLYAWKEIDSKLTPPSSAPQFELRRSVKEK